MAIKASGYTVFCDHCGHPIPWTYNLTMDEAESVVARGLDCIVIDGRVYCCDECHERGEAAR